jgi:hypothetical protein
MVRRTGMGLPVVVVALAVGGVWPLDVSAQMSPSPQPVPSGTFASPLPSEIAPLPSGAPAPLESASPIPTPSPTQPPIIVEPPSVAIAPGTTQVLRVMQVLGNVGVTVADPSIAEAAADQVARTVTITAHAVGRTTLTISDERGLTRDVPIRVAYPAGSVADIASVRITGHPASSLFVKEQAVLAAKRRAVPRPGATIVATIESVTFSRPLPLDDVVTVDVPVILQGADYLTVQGTTHVRVENFAEPPGRPGSLLVSDYPETLRENGILFTADLTTDPAERFLYYHYNPPGQPDRRIVLKAENTSAAPALVQIISGRAGPGPYEMEVGHLSTQRFLVRMTQNEGTVVTLPGNSVTTIVEQLLPAGQIVSNLLQLHEITGNALHLTLLAQNAGDPVEGPVLPTGLLRGDHPHARGVYTPSEFFFTSTYDTAGDDLEVPIGQIPVPNLVEGQALSGDYGVLQSVTVEMVNHSDHASDVALYANPRGGRATGTFLIDGVLVQAHALPAFSHFKLRQYTIPAHGFVRTEVVTMPEGGSSYPLRLIVGPDDGSAPPGAPDSLVY